MRSVTCATGKGLRVTPLCVALGFAAVGGACSRGTDSGRENPEPAPDMGCPGTLEYYAVDQPLPGFDRTVDEVLALASSEMECAWFDGREGDWRIAVRRLPGRVHYFGWEERGDSGVCRGSVSVYTEVSVEGAGISMRWQADGSALLFDSHERDDELNPGFGQAREGEFEGELLGSTPERVEGDARFKGSLIQGGGTWQLLISWVEGDESVFLSGTCAVPGTVTFE